MMRILAIAMIVLGLARSASAAPEIHVQVPTVGIDDAERATHVDAIRRAMESAFHDVAGVKHVDLIVSKLAVVINAETVDVTAEVKVVISTATGEIRSFCSGTATFTIAKRRYRPERALALRHQVLADALDGLQRRLRAQYRPVA